MAEQPPVVGKLPSVEDQSMDLNRIEPASSTLQEGQADISSLSIDVQESEEWKLKHRMLREGIEEPLNQESLRRRSGYCVEWKANQISAYYEKQCELLDGLQVRFGSGIFGLEGVCR